MTARAFFEPIKTLAFGGISAAYASVGAVTTYRLREVGFSNTTQGDMYFSIDGVTDHIFVAAGSYKTIDIQANMNPEKDDKYVLPVGTQFSVKQITAPVSGSVYVEGLAE